MSAFSFPAPFRIAQGKRCDLGTTYRRSSRRRNYICASISPVKFPSLTADKFRHPFDIAATRALRRGIGLEFVVSSVLEAASAGLELDNASNGVLVSAKQLPDIYAQLLQACNILNVEPVPALYIRQSPVPNAYTLAFRGKKPFIVIHTSLLELLNEKELLSVLSHELGHIKCNHGIWLTAANLAISLLPFPTTISEAMSTYLLRWQRSAELSCDRASLLVTQDERVVLSSLMKLSGGTQKYSSQMSVDAYLDQGRQVDELSSSSALGKALRNAMVLSATHPLPVDRCRELNNWAASNHFRSILAAGKPLQDLPPVTPKKKN